MAKPRATELESWKRKGIIARGPGHSQVQGGLRVASGPFDCTSGLQIHMRQDLDLRRGVSKQPPDDVDGGETSFDSR